MGLFANLRAHWRRNPPLTSGIVDSFPGTTIDSAKWPNVTGAVQSNGTIDLEAVFGGAEVLRTAQNLTWDTATVRVHTLPSASNYANQAWFAINTADQNSYVAFRLEVSGGVWQLQALVNTAGSVVNHSSVAYNATNHKYLRLRREGGNVYWDVSANGGSWTNFFSLAQPAFSTAATMGISLFATRWDSPDAQGVFKFANVNSVETAATTNYVIGIHGHQGGPFTSAFGSGHDYPVDTTGEVDFTTILTQGFVDLGSGQYAWSDYSVNTYTYPDYTTVIKPYFDSLVPADASKVAIDAFSAGGAIAMSLMANNWQPPYGELVGYILEDPANNAVTFANPGGVPVYLWASYNGTTWNANDINTSVPTGVLEKYEAALGITRQRMDLASPAGPTDHAPMTRLSGSGPYAAPELLTDEFWNPPAVAYPKVRVGGAWVTPVGMKVRVGGAWVDVVGVKVRVGGAWVDSV